jgi:signal transduction histidine kinase
VSTRVEHGIAAFGDPRLLRIVLENLLGNAWKFTAGRRDTEIAFGALPGEDGATVYCVRDNGAGFDPAWADKLFGNFQRLHSEAEFPGTGLGLANVRRIVTRHGGRVWADSTPGQGARFMFTLPEPSALARQLHAGARHLVGGGTAVAELALGLHGFGEPQVGARPQGLDL